MNYVKKHNNNYARWYGLKEDHQRLYRQRVQSIKSRTINKIKENQNEKIHNTYTCPCLFSV